MEVEYNNAISEYKLFDMNSRNAYIINKFEIHL